MALSLRFGLFNVQYDDEVPGVTRQFAGDSVDSIRATLFLRHHFGKGLGVDAQVPTGTVGARSNGGPEKRLNGFGDIRLGLRYDLSALWGAGGYRPSVVVSGGLALPTGAQSRFDDVNSLIPVTVLALGRGAFGTHVRVEGTQAAARWLLFKGWLGGDLPLTPNGLGITNGLQVDGGVGAVVLPFDWMNFGASIAGQHLQKAQSPEMGEIENSGGTLFAAEINAGVRILEKTFVTVGARAPMVAFLNGRQIGETFSVFASVATSFGGADDDDAHDHGDEHDHGGGHDHGKAHDDGGHKAHDKGGHKAHDEGGHKAHDDGEHKAHDDGGHKAHDDGHKGHATKSKLPPGDVKHTARGGESFAIDDVVKPGRITVIDFWAEWCGPCKTVDATLARLARRHPKLAVRKVEVPTFDTPVALEHIASARGLPVVWIYDATGKRTEVFEGGDISAIEGTIVDHLKRLDATSQ